MIAEPPARILLVEDSAADVLLVRESLADSPVRTRLEVVETANAALAHLHRRKEENGGFPDLVLLDLNLPGFDGLECLAELKRDRRLALIPVVIFSTSDAESDIAAAYKNRANCFVSKPRDFHTFSWVVVSIVRFWLSRPNEFVPFDESRSD